MATVGLYGSSSSGVVAAATGSDTTGLYGSTTQYGGTYFEWVVFQEASTQPATPTGGSWSFTTNTGTPPSGWSNTPPVAPSNTVWVSIGLVNSKVDSTITWSVPGKLSDGNMESKFGSFYDTTSQSIVSTTVAQVVTLNSTAESRGVTLADGSKVTFASQRTYSFTFSMQLQNSDTQIHTATVWLKYNGTDYPNSASVIDVPSSHGGNPGRLIATVNFVATSQAGGGDYVQLYWSGTSTSLSMQTIAAGTSPTRPASPSVILTVVQV